MNMPVYIVVKDRVSDLVQLVDWLEKADVGPIILLDNDSSYPPLVAYLNVSEHEVKRLGANLGALCLWRADLVPDEPFVYTDPDVVPADDCPLDLVAHLAELLEAHPDAPKAGVGLYIDDLPASSPVLAREREMRSATHQTVDTTFALYRPGADFTYAAIRSTAPYEARCLAWYREGQPLNEEDQYYLDHALISRHGGSGWAERIDGPDEDVLVTEKLFTRDGFLSVVPGLAGHVIPKRDRALLVTLEELTIIQRRNAPK